ncbi:MAG: RNA polymerase sigma factor [Bacteroidetes bacterium]|nr:RNA polymerase sigma factor [Bacteroidota bacterium]
MSDERRNFEKMAVNETELIMQAQGGSMDAFEQLVHRHDKRVLTIAAGYVHNADDAKDIYQEVFLRVYKGLSKFKYKSEFSTWIYRITTNVCLSHRSRKRGIYHTSLDSKSSNRDGQTIALKDTIADNATADQHAQDADISERVERALKLLSPRQRMVFTMRHYEGYKLREIAEMMKCSEGTVKKYLFEAIARLRKQLKDFAN